MRKVEIKPLKTTKFGTLEQRLNTDTIIIHHTGNPTDDDLSAEELHASHKRRGWSGIGYHFVVRKDGTIEEGRPLWTVGSHAYGFNANSIGIHVCGNFEIAEPTDAQIEATALLVAKLCNDYGLTPNKECVVGHRDLMPTLCPGEHLYDKLQDIRGKAIWYQNHD